jgi:hypothetical protein
MNSIYFNFFLTQSRKGAKKRDVSPFQGFILVVFEFPGRCPGLVCSALSGQIRFMMLDSNQGDHPG